MSNALKNVREAEKNGLAIGMFLSNAHLAKLLEYLKEQGQESKDGKKKPAGIWIRVGRISDSNGELRFNKIELIPYQNNFDKDTKFEDLNEAESDALISPWREGYMDVVLGYPEPDIPTFPNGKDMDGKTDHNFIRIDNENDGGGGSYGGNIQKPKAGKTQ